MVSIPPGDGSNGGPSPRLVVKGKAVNRVTTIKSFVLTGLPEGATGLLHGTDAGVSELVASQTIEYHAEMRFVPYQPFLASLWVSRVGRSSFTVAAELRVEVGGGPAAVWECVNVLWDHHAQSAWTISDAVRADLEHYLGEPVGFRR